MTRTYDTIRECAELWVSQMNAIPYGMIERLVSDCPDEWREVTYPAVGDRVYVYDTPDECDTLEHGGEIESIDDETYRIELDDGTVAEVELNDFEVERDSSLPMWGWMWQFMMLNSCGVCPSYAVRTATKHDTSKGACCPIAVGNALLDMHDQIMRNVINYDPDDATTADDIAPATPAEEKHDDQLKSAATCPECGEPLIFEGGCNICKSCGWSKCN